MRKFLTIILILLHLVTFSVPAYAEIPRYMQFQGKVTDAEDTPLNGTYKLTFRIYDVETDGTPMWKETHDAVEVENGVFSVVLGGVSDLNLSFDTPYWISIEIDTKDGTNEMPRQLISSVGYAYRAKEADYADVAIRADNVTHINVDNVTIEEVNGQLRLKDGGITLAKFAPTEAGDFLVFSSPSEKQSSGSNQWTKVKEVIIGRPGSLRIDFEARHSGYTVYAQIYRNGQPVGTKQTDIHGSYQTFSEVISGWQAGDKCQLYLLSAHGGYPGYIRNFRLYASETLFYLENEL